jgi:hypothetical protein
MSDLYRRYQPLPAWAYCRDCMWPFPTGLNRIQVEAQVTAHVRETGHEARAVLTSEIIFRAQPAEVPGG